jgi:hypothetical protein
MMSSLSIEQAESIHRKARRQSNRNRCYYCSSIELILIDKVSYHIKFILGVNDNNSTQKHFLCMIIIVIRLTRTRHILFSF